MLAKTQIAKAIELKLEKTADRYDQIWAIKQELRNMDLEFLVCDRETIDDILDLLFEKYGFVG